MAKFYSKNSQKKDETRPRKETIKFLMDYSKALKVTAFKKLKFEAFLN